MEPITTVTGALTLTNTAAELTKKFIAFSKTLKDRDAKHQVDEMLDTLRDLKQSAWELEDQNRELREKLRFKSDDYVFRNPFWYYKDHPEQALCAKCFANHVEGRMGEPGRGCGPEYRHCLVCGGSVPTEKRSSFRKAWLDGG